MRFTVVRCDECRKEDWIVFPIRYPTGWRRKAVSSTETWDLCPVCSELGSVIPTASTDKERKEEVVAELFRVLPNATDEDVATEAGHCGILMSPETVRRYRNGLGIPPVRVRRRLVAKP